MPDSSDHMLWVNWHFMISFQVLDRTLDMSDSSDHATWENQHNLFIFLSTRLDPKLYVTPRTSGFKYINVLGYLYKC